MALLNPSQAAYQAFVVLNHFF